MRRQLIAAQHGRIDQVAIDLILDQELTLAVIHRHRPALAAPAGICAGGEEQSSSLVRCGLLSK